MIEIVFGLFLLGLLVATAMAIVAARNLFSAVMLSSIYSLLMAVNFFLLDAADVALTEAAVGAGVATVFQLGALALLPMREKPGSGGRYLAIAVVCVNAALLLYATQDQPRLGDPNAPVHQHVAPWYFENNAEHIQIPNVVTAVLGSFRGYDTLGEVFVVFTAGIGVFFLLGVPRSPSTGTRGGRGLRHHLIPQVVGRITIPFLLLFGLYVQFHGEYSPGGGFQAGALFAAALILYALIQGEAEALRLVPPRALLWLSAGGTLLFAGVGVLTLLLGGNFLDYSVFSSDGPWAYQLGLILVELGVGIAVTGVLLGIYHAFAARRG